MEMTTLAKISIILSGIIGFLVIIDCFRFKEKVNAYIRYGLLFGFLFVSLDVVIMLLFIPNLTSLIQPFHLFLIEFLSFVRMIIYVCMGMYCCATLGLRDIPLTKMLFKERRIPDKTKIIRALKIVVITAVVVSVYSAILFLITTPRVPLRIRQLSDVLEARQLMVTHPSLLMGIIVVVIAFMEEIIFRLGFQNYLAMKLNLKGQKYWVAIVFTSILWTLGHASVMEPEWVKMAQIFPVGIVLGFLFRRYGTEVCVLTHGLLNVILMIMGPHLIHM
jgi:membrane protease YdiL (CAAX protease family)